MYDNKLVFVIDASADLTVTSGWAMYIYSSASLSWTKIIDGESLDINLTWDDISNKPDVFPPETHTHAQIDINATDIIDLQSNVALFPTKVSELTNDSGFLTSVTKSDVELGNVDNIKQMPISGGVLENYREKLVALSGTSTAINLSLGNVFTHSLTGNTTYTITNAISGQAHSFTLMITQTSTVRTITFPTSVKWQGGDIPDLTKASKTYVLTFTTVNGGTTWLGMFGGEF